MLIILITGCAGTTTTQPSQERHIKHIVLCWLKEPGNHLNRQKIIETSYALRKLPSVLNVSAGEVIQSNRKVVDDSFDVAVIFTFKNQEAMNAYLKDPMHKKAVSEVLMPLSEKVVIYDYGDTSLVKYAQ